MSLKGFVAKITGESSYLLLHTLFHKGSSLPGKIAKKIDPQILKEIGKNYQVIIVTGTNGKTLTTALITKVLKQKYSHILTNPSGANLEQGIITTFLKAKQKKDIKHPLAVLEVDEANVVKVTKYIKPIAIVLTNIFRDQIDRYGEIYTTFNKIVNGIKQAPKATIIANGDDPIFQSVKLPNPKIYFGFKNHNEDRNLKARPNTDDVLCPKCHHILHFHYLTYANLGDYFCPNCGYSRPKLSVIVNKILRQTPHSSTFRINGHKIQIDVGGIYNIYNALTAYTVGKFMHVSAKKMQNAFRKNQHLFGRQEIFKVGNHQIEMILSKNPVGLNQVVDMISHDHGTFSVAWLLNANYADGIDTSWIWDVDFERLKHLNIKQFITGGIRHKDALCRFKMAGLPQKLLKDEPDFNNIINDLKHAPTKKIYVLANYTSMTSLRKMLEKDGFVKKINF